jgi:hypothetical protein
MKRFFAIAMLLFIGFSSCKKKPEEIMADIKKNYTAINNKLKDYKPRRVDDLTNKAQGSITGYYRDEEVKKIIGEHFTDSSRTFSEYYFDDGMVILIIKQHFIYNKPASYTEEKARANNDSVWYDDKKTRLETSRFYFHKNKLIKWVRPDNTEVQPATADFIDKESLLWGETAILIKQLKSSNTD